MRRPGVDIVLPDGTVVDLPIGALIGRHARAEARIDDPRVSADGEAAGLDAPASLAR